MVKIWLSKDAAQELLGQLEAALPKDPESNPPQEELYRALWRALRPEAEVPAGWGFLEAGAEKE